MSQCHASSCEATSVNVNHPAERQAWARIFGVAPGELLAAIREVGHDAEAILLHLRGKSIRGARATLMSAA